MKYFFLLITLLSFLVVNSSANWYNIGPGAGSDLHVIKFHPTDENTIYTGGDIEGIFKTTDFGKTWKNINNNLMHKNYSAGIYWINDIVFNPENPEKLFLATAVGLFHSSNGGDSWEEKWVEFFDNEGISVSTVAINKNNPNIVYMGLGDRSEGSFADFEPFPPYDAQSGFYKSTDYGQSWEEIGDLPEKINIHSIVISEIDDNTIFVSSNFGVFRSNDGGKSFNKLTNGLPHNNAYILKGLMIDGNFYLFLTLKTIGDISDGNTFSGGMFYSSDNGNSWIDITSNLPKYDSENELFYDYWKFDISNDYTIFLGTTRGSSWEESGVFTCSNWDEASPVWDFLYYPDLGAWLNNDWFGDPYVFSLSISPVNNEKIAICTDGVILSSDFGENWQQSHSDKIGEAWSGRGLELMNTDGIAFHPTNPDKIYIGYDDMGFFRSDDGGKSFIRLDPKMDPEIDGYSEVDGVKDIIVDTNGDLYISRWQGSQGGYNANFTKGAVFFSNDDGNSFNAISSGLPQSRIDLVMDKNSGSNGNRTLYAAVYKNGVYKTTYSGKSWVFSGNGLGSDSYGAWEIAVNPNNSNELFLGLNFKGEYKKALYKSNDGGNNWSLVSNFPEGDILSVNYNSEGYIFVSVTDNFDWSTEGGLYYSTDSGENWTALSNLPRIIDISFHPDDSKIFVIANQQWYNKVDDLPGIYLTKDFGNTWENISSNIGHTVFNFVKFHPLKPNFIFTGTGGGGLWVSDSIPFGTGMFVDDMQDSDNNILVFPNPFNDEINIKSRNNFSTANVKIYNILGEKLNDFILEQSSQMLKIKFDNPVNQGVYLMILKIDNSLYKIKLIKN